MLDDMSGFEALGLLSFERIWDNEDDEVWNQYACPLQGRVVVVTIAKSVVRRRVARLKPAVFARVMREYEALFTNG